MEKNGKLRSVYDPDFVYPKNTWVKDQPKPDHGGGIYCYATIEDAINAAKNNTVFADKWQAGKTLVLCECQRRGREIYYNNKIAVEYLRVKKVLHEISIQ